MRSRRTVTSAAAMLALCVATVVAQHQSRAGEWAHYGGDPGG